MSREKQTPAPIRSSAAEVLTYVASTGDPQGSIEIRYEDENIWLTQKTMAQLYDECQNDQLSHQENLR